MSEIEQDQQLGRWPGEAERAPLTEALRELWQMASRDCYDYPSKSHEDPCQCERCIAVRALEAIQGALYPVVRSLTPDRIDSGYRERMFFEAWVAENERNRCINGGRGTLEILCKSLGPITQRDMDVATAVVQWLGTSCGGAFLFDVQRKIDAVNREASRMRMQRLDQWRANADTAGGFTNVEKVTP